MKNKSVKNHIVLEIVLTLLIVIYPFVKNISYEWIYLLLVYIIYLFSFQIISFKLKTNLITKLFYIKVIQLICFLISVYLLIHIIIIYFLLEIVLIYLLREAHKTAFEKIDISKKELYQWIQRPENTKYSKATIISMAIIFISGFNIVSSKIQIGNAPHVLLISLGSLIAIVSYYILDVLISRMIDVKYNFLLYPFIMMLFGNLSYVLLVIYNFGEILGRSIFIISLYSFMYINVQREKIFYDILKHIKSN